jgi:hypothetical protein
MVVMLRRRQRWFSFLFPTTVVVLLLLARALVWCLSEAVLFPVSGDGGGFVLLRVFCFGVRRRWLCFWRRWWFRLLHVRLAFVLTAEFLIYMLQVGFWLSAAKDWLRLVSVKP